MPRTIANFLPALLAQLIPNTMATHAITYAWCNLHLMFVPYASWLIHVACCMFYLLNDQGRRNRSGWSGQSRTTFPQRFKYFRANQRNKSMDGEQVITSYSKVNYTGKDTAQNRITQEFSLLITPHLAPHASQDSVHALIT